MIAPLESRHECNDRVLVRFGEILAETMPAVLHILLARVVSLLQEIALCREHNVTIDPRFRPVYSPRSWQRNLRRFLSRRHAVQKSGVIDLA